MLDDLRYRLRALFRSRSVEQELDEELRFHLEHQRRKYEQGGMSRDEASRRARLSFGGLDQVKEECRQARGISALETTLQDLRYAWRMLIKSPVFTIVAVLSLALGIGANTAIFSLMNTVLLQSLPVSRPDELVVIASGEVDSGAETLSYPMYQDIRDKNGVFTGVLARGGAQVNVSFSGQNEHVRGELVSGNYFDVLGVRPYLGRLFTQDDDRLPGAHPVAVLSYGFWQRRFGGDPAVLGKSILLNEHAMTVIGVAPPGFYGTDLAISPDVRVPMMMATVFNPVPANRLQSRRYQWLTLMARRRADVPLAKAQASLEVLVHQIREGEAQHLAPSASAFDRKQFLSRTVRLVPGNQGFQHIQRDFKEPLLLLFGVTGIVLLILCANLASLLLARATARGQEVSIRLALGAGRLRLVRQWLTESVLLAIFGAIGGSLLAVWAQMSLVSFMPAELQANLAGPLNWRVFGFMLLVSVLAGLLFGLAPAVRASGVSVAPRLRGEATTFASGGRVQSLRGSLIVLQIALSLPLLIGAGLFLRSLRNIQGIDAGFASENVFVATLNPSLNGYPPEKIRNLYIELLEQVRALPGVRSACLAAGSPISGGWGKRTVAVVGYRPRQGEDMSPNAGVISTDYFKTLGTPLVAGREFSEQDSLTAPKVAIINETMAHYYFGDANPIGKKIGTDTVPDTEIVGVVKDAKYVDLRENRLRHFYVPMTQEARLLDLTLHVRMVGNPMRAADMIRAAVQRVDPHLPLYNIKTLAAQVAESLTRDRLLAWLTSMFGLLATLMAVLGLYGVVAFSVARRTREIGIRIAMGAQTGDILRLVLRQQAVLVSAGVTLGLGCALALSRLLASMLYEIKPADPASYVAAALTLGGAAALAAYLPARRATRVDPMTALRYE